VVEGAARLVTASDSARKLNLSILENMSFEPIEREGIAVYLHGTRLSTLQQLLLYLMILYFLGLRRI
jgi:hypothetical protein